MRLQRRQILQWGGGLLATLAVPSGLPRAHELAEAGIVEIKMTGRPDGSMVWFDPIGLRIAPGQTLQPALSGR
jgi:plastocyanin